MQSHNEKSASRPLKVGFVFDDSLDSSDGVAQYVKTLGQWLTGQGHEVNYLVGETKIKKWAGGIVYSLAKNKKVSFNHNKLSIPLPANRKKIQQVIRDGNYDILHVQMPYSPFMAGRIIKYVEPETAIVGTFHILPANAIAKAGSYLLRIMYGRTLSRFDEFISVSTAAATFAKNVFGITSKVLPNVVDAKRFRKPDTERKRESQIVFLGRLVKRKGCFELLKAYDLARQKGLKAKLVIAGDGPERKKLESFVINNELSDYIEFLGYIDEELKPSLLANSDIACFPATGGESFGIVLIEAMAAGSKVILGGDNPGYRTVLGDKPILLINPPDTELFANRLNQLMNDDALISEIGSWLKSESYKYDVEYVGAQLNDMYTSTIAKRRSNIHNINYE